MPLTTGIRLGPYEIVAAIGAGGMGEVYKATDTRLNRTVARDGTRFLRIQQVEPERAVTEIDLVLNWFEEVKRLVSSGAK